MSGLATLMYSPTDKSGGPRLDGGFAASSQSVSLTYSTYLGGNSTDQAQDLAVNTAGEAYVYGRTVSTDFPLMNAYDSSPGDYDAFITKFNASGNGLIFSTYFGGSNVDGPEAMVLFNDEIYVAGYTNSSDFPTVYPVYGTLDPMGYDAFVARLGSGGNPLEFSTFLGGNGIDNAYGIAVRCQPPCIIPSIHIFVTGSTSSSNFPTLNAFDNTLGGSRDAFLAQISLGSFSSSLVYSTYYGGSDVDEGLGIAIPYGSTLHPYITGQTISSDFPTVNAYDDSLRGSQDAFLAGFGIAGNGEVYPVFSTYFGGDDTSGFAQELGKAITVIDADNVCIAGDLASPGVATPGAYDTSYGGQIDAFLAQPAGRHLLSRRRGGTRPLRQPLCLWPDSFHGFPHGQCL